MKLSKQTINNFQKKIWDFYHKQGRTFPWRNVADPYQVVVSELMLQQTQTNRVFGKFKEWIAAFPTFTSLADASLHEVLFCWQGLGYNRRGKYLHEIAQKVVHEFHKRLPSEPNILVTFPGIGQATAASICAFAFNMPTIFIETNIRTVFLYTFFKKEKRVHDRDIMSLVAQTVSQNNPREWYYALMDYGVMLKREYKISNKKSIHYTRQSRFCGSDRQIRGQIIKLLVNEGTISYDEMADRLAGDLRRICRIITDLSDEGLVSLHDGALIIAEKGFKAL